jgi:hypothetical protein
MSAWSLQSSFGVMETIRLITTSPAAVLGKGGSNISSLCFCPRGKLYLAIIFRLMAFFNIATIKAPENTKENPGFLLQLADNFMEKRRSAFLGAALIRKIRKARCVPPCIRPTLIMLCFDCRYILIMCHATLRDMLLKQAKYFYVDHPRRKI